MGAKMTWQEALEIVMVRTGHEPYRRLTADDHPDREIWRARMIAKARGAPPPPPGGRDSPASPTRASLSCSWA